MVDGIPFKSNSISLSFSIRDAQKKNMKFHKQTPNRTQLSNRPTVQPSNRPLRVSARRHVGRVERVPQAQQDQLRQAALQRAAPHGLGQAVHRHAYGSRWKGLGIQTPWDFRGSHEKTRSIWLDLMGFNGV